MSLKLLVDNIVNTIITVKPLNAIDAGVTLLIKMTLPQKVY